MNLAQNNNKEYGKEKIIYEQRELIINNETGEVKEEINNKTIKIPKEDNYIKIYIKTIGLLHNLPNSADKILFELLKYVNYDNEIIINKSVKQNIANRLNLSLSRINMYITNLYKENFLIRKNRGVYILNPFIFGKGNWKDIYNLRKKLELDIVFKEGEIEIKKSGIKE
jgi:hypothetical protein